MHIYKRKRDIQKSLYKGKKLNGILHEEITYHLIFKTAFWFWQLCNEHMLFQNQTKQSYLNCKRNINHTNIESYNLSIFSLGLLLLKMLHAINEMIYLLSIPEYMHLDNLFQIKWHIMLFLCNLIGGFDTGRQWIIEV